MQICELRPGERAWTFGWIDTGGTMDHPCYAFPRPWSTQTAYIERTESGFKKFHIRGFLIRWWQWYGWG